MTAIKTGKLFLLLFLISGLLFSCSRKEDMLIGTWERIGDDLKGMQITIKNDTKEYYGVIGYVTDSNKYCGFIMDDIKWKSIKYVNENRYMLEDLAKTITPSGEIVKIYYTHSFITLVNPNLINVRSEAKGPELETGSVWKKIN